MLVYFSIKSSKKNISQQIHTSSPCAAAFGRCCWKTRPVASFLRGPRQSALPSVPCTKNAKVLGTSRKVHYWLFETSGTLHQWLIKLIIDVVFLICIHQVHYNNDMHTQGSCANFRIQNPDFSWLYPDRKICFSWLSKSYKIARRLGLALKPYLIWGFS